MPGVRGTVYLEERFTGAHVDRGHSLTTTLSGRECGKRHGQGSKRKSKKSLQHSTEHNIGSECEGKAGLTRESVENNSVPESKRSSERQ